MYNNLKLKIKNKINDKHNDVYELFSSYVFDELVFKCITFL